MLKIYKMDLKGDISDYISKVSKSTKELDELLIKYEGKEEFTYEEKVQIMDNVYSWAIISSELSFFRTHKLFMEIKNCEDKFLYHYYKYELSSIVDENIKSVERFKDFHDKFDPNEELPSKGSPSNAEYFSALLDVLDKTWKQIDDLNEQKKRP